ncbi:MAG: ornithine carbamoyltransferase [Candidatus Omnitrophota bacterium]
MHNKDLISINDLLDYDIQEIFRLTGELKAEKRLKESESLKGKTLGLIFQKPSLRTKVSFEVAMIQLGGSAVYLAPEEIKLGQREEIKDVARTLSRYLDGIVARTFKHNDILNLAKYSTIPVINGLSDYLHPCQVLSDLFTIEEKRGSLKDIKLAFIGDGNNVCNSLLHICAKLGVNISAATPKGYEPDKEVVKDASEIAKTTKAKITLTNHPATAAKEADVIYTDVWTSMGQEKEFAKRLEAFKDFQVSSKLCSEAKKDYLIMHCLPAHRGEEITDECLESPHSIVFDQAENRLHVEKAILLLLLK